MFFELTAARALALQIHMGFRSFLLRVRNFVPLGKIEGQIRNLRKILSYIHVSWVNTRSYDRFSNLRGFPWFLPEVRNSGLLGQNEGHIRNLLKILSLTSKTWIIIAI